MRGRGGVVEDISFHDIRISHIPGPAIQITTFYQASTIPPKSAVPPVFRNLKISNVSGTGNQLGIEMKGLSDARLENIVLEHIELAADSALECSNLTDIALSDIRIRKNT